jgi:four helix bundle protein
MGAKTFQELVAWQLAADLREKVVAVSRTKAFEGERRFCDQLRSAASSAPANIAEGFARYTHRDFARFLSIARGSLAETQNHLHAAHRQGLIDRVTFEELWIRSERAMGAITRLRSSL